MWILWLIVGIVFSIAEILSSGFFLIWFAIGAFIALIASFFTSNVLYQGIIFLAVSLILLLTLTKLVAKKFSSHPTLPTNIDSLIGKKGIVTEDIGKDNFESGLVKLDGEIWTAVSKDGHPINKGSIVSIHEIKGVRLIVSQTEI
ncbi:MAG: putative protease [Clostridia bacterium]|jgi:membrane protein implicated in regulation of membrane protease activity|nr:putative protease [Clostridia bacterium]